MRTLNSVSLKRTYIERSNWVVKVSVPWVKDLTILRTFPPNQKPFRDSKHQMFSVAIS